MFYIILFCIGSLKFANSGGNRNTATPIQKNKKQFASGLKGSLPLEAGTCLNYISILKHLLELRIYLRIILV